MSTPKKPTEALESMTVKDLQKELKKYNLKTTGRKMDLVQRLEEYHQSLGSVSQPDFSEAGAGAEAGAATVKSDSKEATGSVSVSTPTHKKEASESSESSKPTPDKKQHTNEENSSLTATADITESNKPKPDEKNTSSKVHDD